MLILQNNKFVCMSHYITIQDAVSQIKQLIETAITSGGCEAKNNLIRTSTPINLLHNAVKADLINKGVNPLLIRPSYGQHVGEVGVAGYFKAKNQDVCVLPNHRQRNPEILRFDGILSGTRCNLGQSYTEAILSINVRSQLSSVAKNFDTLYERTFAESLNLHLRCPNMVLGEFYMIPVYSYDDALANQKRVGFKPNRSVKSHIEKYLKSFGAINNRTTVTGEEYKYERVCLLIVDFNHDIPKIYNTDEELRQDGLLSLNSTASVNHMNFPSFVDRLLEVYQQRFGERRFI